LTYLSFLTTGSKYVVALLLNLLNLSNMNVNSKTRELRYIGYLLIGLDIFFMVASCLCMSVGIIMLICKARDISHDTKEAEKRRLRKNAVKITPVPKKDRYNFDLKDKNKDVAGGRVENKEGLPGREGTEMKEMETKTGGRPVQVVAKPVGRTPSDRGPRRQLLQKEGNGQPEIAWKEKKTTHTEAKSIDLEKNSIDLEKNSIDLESPSTSVSIAVLDSGPDKKKKKKKKSKKKKSKKKKSYRKDTEDDTISIVNLDDSSNESPAPRKLKRQSTGVEL